MSITPGLGMIELAVVPSRTTSKPFWASQAASSSPKPMAAGVTPGSLATKFTPFSSSARPLLSVSQRPWWVIGPGSAGASAAAGASALRPTVAPT